MGTTVLLILDTFKSKRPVHFNKVLNIREVDNQIKMHSEEIHVCLPFIASYAKLNSSYL